MPEPGAAPRRRALAALRAGGGAPPATPAARLAVTSPIDGEELFDLEGASATDAVAAVGRAASAFAAWRAAGPTIRGAFVAALGAELERRRAPLAELITIETGKPVAAASAEVEAAVDVCRLAVAAAARVAPPPTARSVAAARTPATAGGEPGDASRPAGSFAARVPLGPVLVLDAFALPLLGWGAVAPFALACGCPVVWRPAAPALATAVDALVAAARRGAGVDLPGLHAVVLGEADAEEALAGHGRVARVVRPDPPGPGVAIVAASADLEAAARLATAATLAGAGRSPAALRLLFAHESVAAELERRLVDGFRSVRIGDPLEPATDLGPLRDLDAYRDFLDAVQTAEVEGGALAAGGEARDLDRFPGAYYGEPTLVRAPAILTEAAAPILFLATFADLDEALARRDAARPRWSTLFTADDHEATRFLAAPGSDHGFVGVNACPSEPDLARPDEHAWLPFTRPVTGRIDSARRND